MPLVAKLDERRGILKFQGLIVPLFDIARDNHDQTRQTKRGFLLAKRALTFHFLLYPNLSDQSFLLQPKPVASSSGDPASRNSRRPHVNGRSGSMSSGGEIGDKFSDPMRPKLQIDNVPNATLGQRVDIA